MMTFSEALERVKIPGTRISRESWADEGSYEWVVAQKGYPHGIPVNANTAEATGLPQGTVVAFGPYLTRKDSAGVFLPWTPDHEDLFADDWTAVHLS